MRLYLSEDKWQGKYGSQVAWGQVMIDGRPRTTIVQHEPIDGDSIVYKWDRTPGILVRSTWSPSSTADNRWIEAPNPDWIQQTERARALFLYDQYWRDHFVISQFEESSADFLHRGEKAAAIFGLGLRDRMYHDFQLREELRSWMADALERFSVNGGYYAFYEEGNDANKEAVIAAVKQFMRDFVTAFPRKPGAKDTAGIEHIPPSQYGYDVLFQWIGQIEECLRRCVLGQTLSGEAQSTGLGSKVAELHESTFEHIIRFDAHCQAECITTDILAPIPTPW